MGLAPTPDGGDVLTISETPVIRALRARAVNVPIRRPLATATGAVTHVPLVLIDLETDQGITGVGYIFTPAGYAIKPLAAVIEALGEFVEGDPVAPFAIEQKLRKRLTLVGAQGIAMLAVSGIDTACWDAAAKAAGLPLARFLGGVPRPLPAYNSNGLGIMAPDRLATEAVELLEGGFKAIKVRHGRDRLHDRREPDAAGRARRTRGRGRWSGFVAPATIVVVVEAKDFDPAPDRIARVDLVANGSPIASLTAPAGERGEFVHVWRNVPAGSHNVVVRAFDAFGATGEWSRSIKVVDTSTGAAIAIAQPVSGQLYGDPVPLQVNVTPGAASIAHVDYVNALGRKVATSSTAPYAASWAAPLPGRHAITAPRARRAASGPPP